MPAKSILITGCSSGIGLCAAQGLHQRGYRVFAAARQSAAVARLQADGLDGVQLDMDDSDSIRQAVDTVLAATGGTLDALFNNAGFGQTGAVEDLSREALRQQFETNVFGALELTNLVLPAMRRQGHGRIIQNSSVLGRVVMPYRGAYSATKFALEGFSDALRQELAGSGIYISIIEPGPIVSRFRENAYVAFKRHVRPEQSAHRNVYAAWERRLAAEGAVTPFTLPPEAVLKKLIHALESRRPHIRYAVTFPTYLFAGLRRLLPDSALDWIIHQIAVREWR